MSEVPLYARLSARTSPDRPGDAGTGEYVAYRYRAVEPNSGSNVIPRRARPGLAGLRPHRQDRRLLLCITLSLIERSNACLLVLMTLKPRVE